MNKDTELTRRNFLSKGAMLAAGSSIIAIQATAPQIAEAKTPSMPSCTTGDAVYTQCDQVLWYKTIPSWLNTLGTDTVNVKEFLTSGYDLSTALTSAINFLNAGGYGGKILIPHSGATNRAWTSDGGHELKSGISIEGIGWSSPGSLMGSEIIMNSGSSHDHMFRIEAPTMNCSLNDLTINLGNKPAATGLLMRDHNGSSIVGNSIYNTTVKNVQFTGGAYGIRVDSFDPEDYPFECILNRFERVFFYGCTTSFSCNTGNGGYVFDTCRFFIPPFAYDPEPEDPPVYGTCLDCQAVGYAEFGNCLFTQNTYPWEEIEDPDEASTVLKTGGAFGSIYFHNCQDENIRYFYQNSTNDYFEGAFVVQNCLLQGSFRFNSNGSAIIDTCQINATPGVFHIIDSSSATARVFLKGLNRLYSYTTSTQDIAPFNNDFSQLLTESHEINPLVKNPTLQSGSPNYYEADGTLGIVTVVANTSSVTVKNKVVIPDSLIFAHFRENPGSAAIKYIDITTHEFTIYLTANVTSNTKLHYKVIQ